jgi:hypothetical protein
VGERFQLVRERAAWLFERDPDFRDLCDEYDTCARTVARHAAGGASSEALRQEYAALMLRLERELLRHLEEHPERNES